MSQRIDQVHLSERRLFVAPPVPAISPVQPPPGTPAPDTGASAKAAPAGAGNTSGHARQAFFEAAQLLREAIGPTASTRLQFNIVPQTNIVQVVVVDASTGEVVREVPPDALVRFAQSWDEYLGNLVDEEA
jgi:flagellar protein FlaG